LPPEPVEATRPPPERARRGGANWSHMDTRRPLPEAPPPEIRYRQRVSLVASLRELGTARELIIALTEREFRARYKQTILGIGWSVVTPIVFVGVFALFVNRVAHVDTMGVPYALFALLGLVVWSFFSASVSRGGQSLVLESDVIRKVRCPLEVFPISTVASAGIDAAVSTILFVVLFVAVGANLYATMAWAPLMLAMLVAFSVGVALVLAAVLVFFRDLQQLLPVALQIGLFITPVAYGASGLVGENWRSAYAAVNPLVGVIDGLRETVLYGNGPPWSLVVPSLVAAGVWLVGGFLLFKYLESGVVDVA
jgi:ABC-type polysaccharide/polyol phosphate export permease